MNQRRILVIKNNDIKHEFYSDLEHEMLLDVLSNELKNYKMYIYVPLSKYKGVFIHHDFDFIRVEDSRISF